MSQFVETPTRSFAAGAARDQFLRVKLPAGVLTTAGATDVAIGTQEAESFAATDVVPVRLRTAQGTRKMVASEAITAGNPVYGAADGKVAASGTVYEGIALEAATADGDVIEVMPAPNVDVSQTATGTNATAFEVDADSTTPKLAIAGQTAGTGDFTTTLKPESTLSADNTILVPEANNDTLAAVALAQSLTNKTLGAGTNLTSGASTAAAGSTTADAGALPAGTAPVYPTTAADDTKGVKIHASDKVTGRLLFIGNGVSAKVLKVYPPAGGTINGGSADAAFSSVSGKGVIAYCLDSATNAWLAW